MKFSLLGVRDNTSIEFFINDTNYILNNSESLEIEFTFKNKSESLISFNLDENIENTMFVEVIVGFVKEDLDSYKQIDFNNSLGNIVLENKKGIIIKIPEELNEELYDFSIIIPDEKVSIYDENMTFKFYMIKKNLLFQNTIYLMVIQMLKALQIFL